MLIADINSIRQIAPNIIEWVNGVKVSNRQLPADQMIWFETRGVNIGEQQLLEREFAVYATTKNPEERVKERSRLEYEQARKKFIKLHNYFVPGPEGPHEVTDFDDFCRVAPQELVAWYFDVIQWGERLSAAERANFLPPAASPSGSQ